MNNARFSLLPTSDASVCCMGQCTYKSSSSSNNYGTTIYLSFNDVGSPGEGSYYAATHVDSRGQRGWIARAKSKVLSIDYRLQSVQVRTAKVGSGAA